MRIGLMSEIETANTVAFQVGTTALPVFQVTDTATVKNVKILNSTAFFGTPILDIQGGGTRGININYTGGGGPALQVTQSSTFGNLAYFLGSWGAGLQGNPFLIENQGTFYLTTPYVGLWLKNNAGGAHVVGQNNITIDFAGGSSVSRMARIEASVVSITGTLGTALNIWTSKSGTDLQAVKKFSFYEDKFVIGTFVPTAFLDISAATTTTASLRLRSGVAPTSPNLGDMWYDGTDFLVRTTTRNDKVARVLTASATLDFPNTAGQASSDLTITVTGAAIGDCVALGQGNSGALTVSCFTAFVAAADTVTVRFNNYDNGPGGAKNPASQTFKVIVFKNI
jgi:hypothetical protein